MARSSSRGSESALAHKTRKAVFNYIRIHPGATFGAIRTVFGLPDGTLRYHLQFLERQDMIFSMVKGNQRRYYPEGSPKLITALIPSRDPRTLTSLQQRIVEHVKQSPGTTITGICDAVKAEKRVLQYNLKVLRQKMFILKVGSGRSTKYVYTTKERLITQLLRFLTAKFLRGEINEYTYVHLKGEIERMRLED